ncbi:DUF4157 domain-containing protein [Aureisphaera galaxeae]|uniref:eCIS core domain-containing protein n=1 Tax=Aureisphaera galaxeae TaxID=1538023 RepID=UPI002350FABE|nr:DUF4157 domain-containing protein [Aureisphaera galaxeae]MDC8005367.1 DUF4157 domain-containing protein [Aureisphaera galaxeae]
MVTGVQKYDSIPQGNTEAKSFVSPTPVIQKKLKIGATDDAYEKEADAIADKVMQANAEPTAAPSGSGPLVQKKCSNCEEELQKKSLSESITPWVQKRALSSSSEGTASDAVTQQIQSSKGGGSAMDTGTRSFMESQFGNDFSNVRIHTGSEAIQLSQDLNAKAFTVGNDVYFNEGKYNPNTRQGKHLLAHELTHVVQQGHASQNTIRRFPVETGTLPTFGQLKETCASASQISALMIQGKNSKNDSSLIAAIENVITWLIHSKSTYVDNLKAKGYTNAEDLQKIAVSSCYDIRDNLLAGTPMTQDNYQELATILHLYYSSTGNLNVGLKVNEMDNVRTRLGIDGGASDGLNSGSDIFNNSVTNALLPGQTAQVGWFVKIKTYSDGTYKYGYHAFLIGRTSIGEWFLHDQAYTPAKAFEDTSKSGLEDQVKKAVKEGTYWLMFNKPSFSAAGMWTGIKLLNTETGPQSKQGELISKGTHLAEVDYSSVRFGDHVYAGDFLGAAHTIKDAYKVARTASSGKGVALVEMPKGTFLLYETNAVATHNLQVDSIDESGGGKLTRKIYYRAYLFLTDGSSEKIIKVY